MLIRFSDHLSIEDGFNFEDFLTPVFPTEFELDKLTKMFDDDVKVFLQGKTYDVLPMSKLCRTKGTDGKYHAIYIWINYDTGEYYIGKVNRDKWTTVKRYTGSGIVFTAKYAKHSDRFRRFYLLSAKTNEECEQLEAEVVNEELLKDPFCLNKITGGGGIRHSIGEDQKKKQSDYMKAHPEQYKAMIEAAKNLDVIRRRSEKISRTMSDSKYKEMTSNRIKNWRKNHPEEYRKSREKNLLAINDPEVKRKGAESRKKWKQEHPEEWKKWEENRIKALSNPKVKQKRIDTMNRWKTENPEAFEARKKKMIENGVKNRIKPVVMIDLESNEKIKEFKSIKEAANWVMEQGLCKGSHPQTTIGGVCQKKKTPGHGQRKSAFGYGWEFVKK